MSLAIDKQDNKNGAMPEIVISNVPELVYEHLKAHAQQTGLTLEELVMRILNKDVNLNPWSQIFEERAPYRSTKVTLEIVQQAIDESREERANRVFREDS
jgi:hypothetical protein